MLSSATKQVMNFIEQAERLKNQLQQSLRELEAKKSHDENKLKIDAALVARSRSDPNMDTAIFLRETYQDKKRIMDDNHEISELKRKIVDADKKISEINHWTEQSEFNDPKKQKEAVEMANRTLQSI